MAEEPLERKRWRSMRIASGLWARRSRATVSAARDMVLGVKEGLGWVAGAAAVGLLRGGSVVGESKVGEGLLELRRERRSSRFHWVAWRVVLVFGEGV